MKKFLSFFGFLFIIGFASQASAIIVNNPSFEETPALNGWLEFGSSFLGSSIVDANGKIYLPEDGKSFAELRGIDAGISQELSWSTGDTISFDWNYLNYDGSADDFGFFEIGNTSSSIVITEIEADGTNSTGWKTFTYTFASDSTSGSYIKFSVDSDLSYNSTYNMAPILLVDNIQYRSVPLPSALLLLGSGLFTIAGIRRKNF